MSSIKVSIIVAMSENRVIGKDNQLPWRISADMKYFKQITMGRPVVMGRKTFESIGRPLPGRKNIVVTRQASWRHDDITIFYNVEEALDFAIGEAQRDNQDEVMVIGGSEIYRQVLPICDKLYVTRVHAQIDGDAFFPNFEGSNWRLSFQQIVEPLGNDQYTCSFMVYDKLLDAN